MAKAKASKKKVGVCIILHDMAIGDVERERTLVRVDLVAWGRIRPVGSTDPISPNH